MPTNAAYKNMIVLLTDIVEALEGADNFFAMTHPERALEAGHPATLTIVYSIDEDKCPDELLGVECGITIEKLSNGLFKWTIGNDIMDTVEGLCDDPEVAMTAAAMAAAAHVFASSSLTRTFN